MWPCLLAGEAEPLDDLAHAGRPIGGVELLLGDRAQIIERVGARAVLIGIGTSDDDRGEPLLLLRVQLARPARFVTIVEAVDAFGVVALDRIAERVKS